MKNKLYSVTDVINEIVDLYDYKRSKGSLRKKIQNVCEQIPSKDGDGKISNLWETSNVNAGTNHYFTEMEKCEIMGNQIMLDFIGNPEMKDNGPDKEDHDKENHDEFSYEGKTIRIPVSRTAQDAGNNAIPTEEGEITGVDDYGFRIRLKSGRELFLSHSAGIGFEFV